MNDLDLEDIECRLYSEVYHGIIDETEQNLITNPIPTILSKPTNDMRRPSARYFGPWSPGAKFQNKNASPKSNHSRPPNHNDFNRSDGFYSKDSGRPQRPEIPLNQVVRPTTLVPVVYMSRKQARYANWKANRKAKILEKKNQKRKNKLLKKQAQIIKDRQPDAIITLSDSDDESCVVVENKRQNDEKNSAKEKKLDVKSDIILNETSSVIECSSDDVIFVEPAPIEIINLDEEPVSPEQSVEIAEAASFDTTITNSPKKDVRQLHQERKELLGTPDSASNDFMNNSGLEVGRKFNFSLHGSDFNSGEFLKPAARNETCETESSSSTTDVNSVNLMKTVVFNEVDFPRDDIFSENNLETFGNFITPLRNNAPVSAAQSSPITVTEVLNQKKNRDSSDSSSESELEESQIDKQVQRVKNLPELSPMQRNKDIGVLPVAKKSKKSNLSSKFDLVNTESPTSSSKEVKQKNVAKKKKKKKKNKSSECGAIDNLENFVVLSSTSTVENDVAEGELTQNCQVEVEEQLRQKKRRSSQLEGSPVLENQPKRKAARDENEQLEIAGSSETRLEIISTEVVNENCKEINTEIIETSKLEITVTEKSCSIIEQTENSTFDGLIVVDEVNQESTMILSSDAESVLSALHESQDIQINCEQENDFIEENKDSDNFSVKNLQRMMSNDPNLWEILDSDKSPYRRSKGRRCNRCKQFGHMAIRCRNKVEVKCALCGGSGHFEPRCPNKICTQCGQRSPYSTTYCSSCFRYRNHVCQLCFVVGHNSETCPDLWRRYHLTTTEGPLTRHEGPTKEKNQLWCSGCAKSGHLEHSCRFYKSIYPASDPFIKSYEDIYKEEETNENQMFMERPPAPENYGVGNVERNYFVEPANSINLLGYSNYNQNSYGQMGQLVNPYIDGVFLANQQNLFSAESTNMFQVPQNTYPTSHSQIVFENQLPAFISFDTQNTTATYDQAPSAPNTDFGSDRYLNVQTRIQSKIMKRNNSLFFSSSGLQLQHFLNEELHRLSKLSVMSNKIVKDMRKRPVPRRNNDKEEYYETLNMLLFGVFHLIDGKMHLERLKKFKLQRYQTRIPQGIRRRLYTSYCYIFGRDPHYDVDYDDLLRRI